MFLPYSSLVYPIPSLDFRLVGSSSVQRLKLSWFQIQEHLRLKRVLQFRSEWVHYFFQTRVLTLSYYEPTCPVRTVRGMSKVLCLTVELIHISLMFRHKTIQWTSRGFIRSTSTSLLSSRTSGYSRVTVRKPTSTPAITTKSWQLSFNSGWQSELTIINLSRLFSWQSLFKDYVS